MRHAGAAGTIGCDIGGSNVKLLLLRGGRLSRRQSVPCPADCGQKEFVDRLVDLLRPLPAASAGIALPGFLDGKRRKILRLSNLPQLDGLHLATRLERRLKWNILLEADSNAGAVGEARLGAGREFKRLLYLSLGTGLGAALTIEGVPVRVSNNTVGHVAGVPIGGQKRRGAEKLLSAKGILGRFRKRSRRSRIPGTLALFELARDGDQAALDTWFETGELLAELLVHIRELRLHLELARHPRASGGDSLQRFNHSFVLRVRIDGRSEAFSVPPGFRGFVCAHSRGVDPPNDRRT